MEFSTKQQMLEKLRAYAKNPDDDIIRAKERVKEKLLGCPELLYALHNENLETELFDSNGNLNLDGEWDRYFGKTGNIRPVVFVPQSQEEIMNFLLYKVEFKDYSNKNYLEKYLLFTVIILVHGEDAYDSSTGIPRTDLISAIIRENFNWANVFGAQCRLVENKEGLSDNNYVTRTMVFETTAINSIVKTTDKTKVINNLVRR